MNILAQQLFEHNIIDQSIYNFQELLENRLEFIKSRHKGVHDETVDYLAQNVDPTPNKKYTEWLLDRHLKGDTALARTEEVRNALSHFDKASGKVHDTNIKNHSLDSMIDVAHIVKHSPAAKSGEGTLKKIYEENEGDGKVLGFKIPDAETSKRLYGFGSNMSTRWCTAARTANNAFDEYTGGKYTMHFPNGAFLQLHHDTLQLKDPENHEINIHADDRYSPYEDHIKKFMKQTAKAEGENDTLEVRHFGTTDEDFENDWKDASSPEASYGDKRMFIKSSASRKLSDDQFKFVLDNAHISMHSVLENPHLTHGQVTKVMDYVTTTAPNSDGVMSRFASMTSNPAVKGENADRMVNTLLGMPEEGPGYAHKIASMPNLQHHHVAKLIHNIAIGAPNNSEDALDYLTDSTNRHVFKEEHLEHMNELGLMTSHTASEIAQKQRIPEHMIDKLVPHYQQAARMGSDSLIKVPLISRHNKFTPEHIHSLIDAVDSYNGHNRYAKSEGYHHILKINGINDDHLKRIMHMNSLSGEKFIKANIFSNTSLSNNHISQLLDNNPLVELEHLSHYLTRRDAKPDVAEKIVEKAGINTSRNPYDAMDLDNVGFYKLKGVVNKTRLSNPREASYIGKNLNYQPQLTPDDLHTLINTHRERDDNTMSTATLQNITQHPSFNVSHAENLYKMHTELKDRMFSSALEGQRRIPPSIQTKLMTD
jgi:hypothetical protein